MDGNEEEEAGGENQYADLQHGGGASGASRAWRLGGGRRRAAVHLQPYMTDTATYVHRQTYIQILTCQRLHYIHTYIRTYIHIEK
jgi:hypothetical protein